MPLKFCSFSGWDRRLPAMFIDVINQFTAVVPSIRQYMAVFYINVFKNRDCIINIISLSLAEHYEDGIPIRIYYCMDFCAGSSTAAADFTWRPPFFAPALCWCAWTMEASSDNSSNSASRLRIRKIWSRMPSSIHFLKRLYTVSHGPYRSGKSRQGAPLRAIQTMPLIV